MTATPNLEQHYLESLSDEELDGLHDSAVQERLSIARQANIYKLEMDRRARIKAEVH